MPFFVDFTEIKQKNTWPREKSTEGKFEGVKVVGNFQMDPPEVQSEFECSICSELFSDPKAVCSVRRNQSITQTNFPQLPCGHTFCHGCLVEWIGKAIRIICPVSILSRFLFSLFCLVNLFQFPKFRLFPSRSATDFSIFLFFSFPVFFQFFSSISFSFYFKSVLTFCLLFFLIFFKLGQIKLEMV